MSFARSIKVLAVTFVLAGCQGGSSVTGTGSSAGVEEAGEAVGAVEGLTYFTPDENGDAVLTLEPLSSGESYIIGIYNSDSDGETSTVSSNDFVSDSVSGLQTGVLDDSDATSDFHLRLRELEAQLGSAAGAPTQIRAVTRAVELDDQRTFKVLDNLSDTSEIETVTANLVLETDNFAVYIDERDEDSLTPDNIEELFGPFDAVVEDERGLFGTESDVNDDDVFVILLSRAVNELGALSGGIVSGYFFGMDLYSNERFSSSNEMEIIFALVPDPEGDFGSPVSKDFALSNILPTVFPHELQHLINFNQHVFVNGGSSEAGFLNEGLSHLAEDIYGLNGDGYMEEVGLENPSRVNYFLADNSGVCFTCGTSIAQRGGSYLFMRYLYEQAEKGNLSGAVDGQSLLQSLLDTTRTGLDNLSYASLGVEDADAGFDALMRLFAVTLVASETDLISDDRFELEGISLSGAQNDNRGTVLRGPVLNELDSLDFSGSVMSSGIAYYRIESGLMPSEQSLDLTFPDDFSGGGFIVKIVSE